ncbi:MAG: PD-(D/E)XK nuclease family protein, partial [Planctomycetota bacterium]|nr:PD-(D/E)XK nuclease family protein [Planctomycetota bacterium]
ASRRAGAAVLLYDGLTADTPMISLSDADCEAVRTARENIGAWRTAAAFEPVSVILRRALLRSGYIAACGYPNRHAQAAANLEKLLDLIAARERAGRGSLRELVAWLEARADADAAEPEASVRPEGISGIRIMTVHAAKGLEFGVVVVPELEAEVAGDVEHGVILEDPGTGPILSIRRAYLRADVSQHPLYLALRETRKMKTNAEIKRLFYVACTRASNILLLAGSATGILHARGNRWLDYLPLLAPSGKNYPEGKEAGEWVRSNEGLNLDKGADVGRWDLSPGAGKDDLNFEVVKPVSYRPQDPAVSADRFKELARALAKPDAGPATAAPSIIRALPRAHPPVTVVSLTGAIGAEADSDVSGPNGIFGLVDTLDGTARDASSKASRPPIRRRSGIEPLDFGILFHAIVRNLPMPKSSIRRACHIEASRAVLGPQIDRERLESELYSEVSKAACKLEQALKARHSYAELPFIIRCGESVLIRGRLDRLWLDEERDIWEVVDYKTSVAEGDRGGTYAAETASWKHDLQIRIYAASAMQVIGQWGEREVKRVSTTLYFTATGSSIQRTITQREADEALNLLAETIGKRIS